MSEITLPALGESVTEGTVTRWLKQVGDTVAVDEPIVEVSTDKVDTEVPSPFEGVLEEILVQEDETIEVGTVLARVGDGSGASGGDSDADESEEAAPAAESQETEAPSDDAPAADAPVQEEPSPEQEEPAKDAPAADETAEAKDEEAAPAAAPAPAPAASAPKAPSAPAAPSAPRSSDGPVYVTPIVRKLANERGVDLASISGTGVGGRIRKEDVLAAAESAPKSSAGSTAASKPTVEVSELRGTTEPLSRLRKVIAKRAVESMQATAQLTTVVEVDVTKIAELRTRVKDEFLEKTGQKLSFLPFFALAAVEALKTYPRLNATVEDDKITYPETENLSIAVDAPRGLLTPVVKGAGELDIRGYAEQIADLANRARDNKLGPDELSGGTFTLTNTGSRGALFDTPIVFLPQLAILGVGVVQKKPVVVSAGGVDAIAVRSMVYLALSYDHRIIDGADAARYLGQVKERLEGGAFEGDLGL
ncbi:2-oxoglutarate dehydrogenase, E2 component, dihydrolipoamide succinyltransferase [Humidisolicoccus flavus]|uniref:2-oxoglutarate dehydrogenase, E2 component, dihydrolipoamide succinyltransferase n=1 Tax=Humidisolicoccus flavus TaxID=3111414 RepID=UPI0032441A9A